MWRTPVAGALDAGIGALVVQIANFWADLQGSLADDTAIISTEFCREGESVFLPSVVGVTVTPTGGSPAANSVKRASAQHLSFVARSSGGQRWIVYQYGFLADQIVDNTAPVPDDFRINPGEDATIDSTIGDLNGVFTTFCGNDGLQLTWQQYANMKINDNVLKKIRKGA